MSTLLEVEKAPSIAFIQPPIGYLRCGKCNSDKLNISIFKIDETETKGYNGDYRITNITCSECSNQMLIDENNNCVYNSNIPEQ